MRRSSGVSVNEADVQTATIEFWAKWRTILRRTIEEWMRALILKIVSWVKHRSQPFSLMLVLETVTIGAARRYRSINQTAIAYTYNDRDFHLVFQWCVWESVGIQAKKLRKAWETEIVNVRWRWWLKDVSFSAIWRWLWIYTFNFFISNNACDNCLINRIREGTSISRLICLWE